MSRLQTRFSQYWYSEAGPGEVLQVALPLFLSMVTMTIQVFVDRMFLTWHSEAATAAAIPAVCILWVLLGPLNGIVTFANTFVAQYHGAGRNGRIGASVGQAILLGAVGGAALLMLVPAARPLFQFIGHDPLVADMETAYLQTLLASAAPMLVMNAAGCFFGGLGRTWVVLLLNVVATSVNLLLDYALIFGNWGFPNLGIAGAGWATAIGYTVAAALSLVLLWAADGDGVFGIQRPRRRIESLTDTAAARAPFFLKLDAELMNRLLRFGGPNGLMVFIDVLAWTWFVLLLGRLGTRELAASNVAFNVNMFAFGPIMGIGTAVQILVGQRLGEDRPGLAARSTWSAFWLAFVYTMILSAGYLFTPDLFLLPFRYNTSPEDFAAWRAVVVVLLRYVVIYALFDMAAFIFASALRGAGDTRFVMLATLGLALGVMVVPSYVAIEVLGAQLFVAWCFVAGYVMALGTAFFARFQSAVWQSMRVIETPAIIEESPALEPAAVSVPACQP